jgi:hypothetical protein
MVSREVPHVSLLPVITVLRQAEVHLHETDHAPVLADSKRGLWRVARLLTHAPARLRWRCRPASAPPDPTKKNDV